jgi:hypoxanthine phosphoribosyltransferase
VNAETLEKAQLAASAERAREAVAARTRARLVCSAEAVEAALDRMAAQISAELAGTDPVVLAVMHGGVFAAVELSRRCAFPHEFDFVHVTRYGNALSGGALEWRVPPRAALAGRTVLVVDDVLDRGVTLAALSAELARIGVAAERRAVLVVKELAEPAVRPAVDFVGVTVGDVYVFGCGMDFKGYWRGLAALYALDDGAPAA